MSKWRLQSAKPGDLPDLIAIQKTTALQKFPNEKYGVKKSDIERINKNLDNNMPFLALSLERGLINKAIKAIVDDKVVGFIFLEKGSNQNKISAFYVLPDFEKRGIGTSLMKKGLKWLGSEKPIFLETVTYQEQAIRFYENFGFVQKESVEIRGTELENGKYLPEVIMERIIK